MSNPTPYVSRIGMSHKIDRDGVTFLPGESPGNALSQFERWVERIVQEEVERRLRNLNGKQALEIGRIQAEANALGRLRTWSTVYRLVSLRVGSGLPFLLLEDLEQMPAARVSVWDRPWKHGSPPADDRRYIVLGTQDNPASLAEMVTAALDRWKELHGEENQ